MLRSPDPRVSVRDKLQFLWMLCLIAHLKERGQKVTWFNIETEFGSKINYMFNFYREMAMDYGYIAPDSHTLTPKAQRVVAKWRDIQKAILDV